MMKLKNKKKRFESTRVTCQIHDLGDETIIIK